MKIIFMGTPQFARTVLEYIYPKHEVVLIVSQPDAAKNRKGEWIYSPVKEFALAHNIPLLQPQKVKEVVPSILEQNADIIVTAAFGQILPKILLEHFRYKSVNVHGSLLPKYRGGAPIQRAIMNGETETGISIMYMKMKMDSGDILKQEKILIMPEDNQDSIFVKLADLGGRMLLETLEELENQTVEAVPQEETEVTYAYNLTKEDEKIDFTLSADVIVNQVRGLCSNPGAYTTLDDSVLKIFKAKKIDMETSYDAGSIIGWSKNEIFVSCNSLEVVAIQELQLAGKKRMKAIEFINGFGRSVLKTGKRLGGPYEK